MDKITSEEVRIINGREIIIRDDFIPYSKEMVVSERKALDSDLESSIKKVLDMNIGIEINKIQYSKEKQTLYFYAPYRVETLDTKEKFLKEIDNVFNNKDILDSDCVTLYDVLTFLRGKNKEYKQLLKKMEEELDRCLAQNGFKAYTIFDNFDYKKQRLSLKIGNSGLYVTFAFTKKEGLLKVVEDSWFFNEELKVILPNIDKFYDQFMKFYDLNNLSLRGLKPVNSSFIGDITWNRVEVIMCDYLKKIIVSANTYDNNYRILYYTVPIYIDKIDGKEEDIFRNIYLKLDNFPIFMQSDLRKLKEERMLKEDRLKKIKEMEKIEQDRKLTLKKKLFPWFRNF